MESTQNKRRERIKTFLIIFLVIMLILTFCANSILNYSLPVVSAQYAGYGTVTERVRGTGSITANQNYEVTADSNRTVASVSVKTGDEIRAGEVLFTLEADNSGETVQAAREALQAAELAYQKALLTAVPDYAAQNQEIANARADLQTAIARLNEAKSGGSGISQAQYNAATAQAADANARIEILNGYISALSSGDTAGIPGTYSSDLSDAALALSQADAALAAAQADRDAKAAAVKVTTNDQKKIIADLERKEGEAETAYNRAKQDYEASSGDTALLRAMEDAKRAWDYAKEDTAAARDALTGIGNAEAALSEAEKKLTDAQTVKTGAQLRMDSAVQTAHSNLESELEAQKTLLREANSIIESYTNGSQGGDITALEDAVTAQERNIQNLLIALGKTQTDDKLAQQIAALDLEAQKKEIDRLKDELTKAEKNSGTQTVASKNAGIVSAVNFAAGDTVMQGDVLAVVTLTDSGYTVQFSASAKQAQKVQPGAQVDISTSSYSYVEAKLEGIKADTQNQGNKLLTFSVTGDVTPGDMANISVPCSSASYECVVPNSAIMEDSDGKFVLVVTAKNTPLGNRYYVNRASVTVLASDDMNSAVQGDVNSYDFIVTASEKPLTPGMQVRMEGD